ncbi:protein detoxification 6 [Quercus suber]|uniref:Protein detoxification 6 n=1 Tax=Quercus suber TaxID=58331 RepID=A0AAW0KKE9_QUESU
MKYSSACEKTPAVFSKDVFFSMRELFCFAVASAAMYSFFGYILTITNLYYYIPYGFAATARLSWELGMHKQLNDCYNEIYCSRDSLLLPSCFGLCLSQVPRGSGWQDIGAYVNLEVLFWPSLYQLKGKGLWIGILTGSTVDAFLLALKTISQIGKNMLLVPKKKKKKKFYLSIYLVLFLHLSTTKFHVQLDHIV